MIHRNDLKWLIQGKRNLPIPGTKYSLASRLIHAYSFLIVWPSKGESSYLQQNKTGDKILRTAPEAANGDNWIKQLASAERERRPERTLKERAHGFDRKTGREKIGLLNKYIMKKPTWSRCGKQHTRFMPYLLDPPQWLEAADPRQKKPSNSWYKLHPCPDRSWCHMAGQRRI